MSTAIPQAEIMTAAGMGPHHDAVEATVEEAEARREVEGVCSGPLRGRMFAVSGNTLDMYTARTHAECTFALTGPFAGRLHASHS